MSRMSISSNYWMKRTDLDPVSAFKGSGPGPALARYGPTAPVRHGSSDGSSAPADDTAPAVDQPSPGVRRPPPGGDGGLQDPGAGRAGNRSLRAAPPRPPRAPPRPPKPWSR